MTPQMEDIVLLHRYKKNNKLKAATFITMQLLFPSFSANSSLFLNKVAVGAVTRLETPWTDHQLWLNSNY